MLNGFRVINLISGLPSLSITKNGVGLNKASIVKLEYTEKVLLMINDAEKMIAVQKCENDNPNATQFYKKQRNVVVRWNNSDLLSTLEKMMGWDVKKNGFKVTGEYDNENFALIFDLKKATQIGDSEVNAD